MWRHMSVECPECHKHSSSRPCEVVEHIPSKRRQRPVWLLRCYYCRRIFPYTPAPNMGKILRARGVPKDVWRAISLTAFMKFAAVAVRPHTEEELEVVKQAIQADMKRRVQLIGKDSAFVDEAFYTKGIK